VCNEEVLKMKNSISMIEFLIESLEYANQNIKWHKGQVAWYKEMLKTEEDALARVTKQRDELVKQIEEEQDKL
jgi:hypothetical protein